MTAVVRRRWRSVTAPRVLVFVTALVGVTLAGSPAARASAPAVCTAGSGIVSNVNTSCAGGGQYFEDSIAVNPRIPANLVAAVIVLSRTSTGVVPQIQPRFSFDGGVTWISSQVDYGTQPAVDPSIAFDAEGTAYLAATNNGTIVVARSADGGVSWSPPVVVAAGHLGRLGGTFNDHPQLSATGDGDVLVTWIHDVFGAAQKLVTAPVQDAASVDGATTWSTARTISGTAAFCTGRQGGHACDQTFGNAVAVGGGRAVVTFQDTYDEAANANAALGRDKYLSVIVNPDTGAVVAGPFLIGQAYDGLLEHDYPASAGDVQTLHDSEFNLDGMGNVAADPTSAGGGHFAIVWYDDRNAAHPVNADPYAAVTDADIIVSQTFDGGRTWSAPKAIAEPNDQIMPWAVYDAHGRLRIGFLDRRYDPANLDYGVTLATETSPGSLRFSTAKISTALSNPTRNDSATLGTVNAAFPNPAPSIGDYTGLAAGPSSIYAMWTDMRNVSCVLGHCGFTQNAYFSAIPDP